MDAALPRRAVRFPLRSVLVTAALIALAAVSYAAYLRYATQPPAAPLQAAVPARKAPISQSVSTTGQIAPRRQAKLAPGAAGLVKELPVTLGQRVQPGQLLARLDTTTLDLKLAQARSALRTAELKVQQLKAGPRPEEVAAAQAGIDSAQAKLAELQGGAPAAELAQAAASAEQAAAGVRSAQAKLQQVQAGPTAADAAQAEQAVAAAQSALQKAEADLTRAKAGPTADEVRQAELAVEGARNALWSQQISRDALCSRDSGGQCEASRAQVAAGETAVTRANEALATLRRGADPLAVQTAQSAVDSAGEALRAARARLAQLRAGATSEDVGQARSAVESAQAGHASAVAKLDAVRQGPKTAEVAAAQAALIQAQAQLALKRAPATPAEVALADEAVESAKLQLRQAEVDLAGATLVAPFEGVVGALQANAGEPIGQGGALLTLVDPAASRVDVAVDESDIARIAADQPARITFDALPDRRYTGKVVGIAPSATVSQGVATYAVAVSIDDADAAVQPGMTANVQLVVAEKPDALVVPNRAIRRVANRPFVEVGGEMRAVQTGIVGEQLTEVVSGLQEGEQVSLPLPTGAATGAVPNKVTTFGASAGAPMKGEMVIISKPGP
jgi:HlyD family secretion protein